MYNQSLCHYDLRGRMEVKDVCSNSSQLHVYQGEGLDVFRILLTS